MSEPPPKRTDPRRTSITSLARRRVLRGGASLAAVSLMSACGDVSFPLPSTRRSGGSGQSAILLPLSGEFSDLGQNLQSSAKLGGGPGIGIKIIDSGSTPETAVVAARQAVAAGAQMIVGPVFSSQTAAVAAAVRVPVVSLSNNEALAGGGTFVFGVTPGQSAQAILSVAAQRNLRRVATVVPPGTFGAQSADAAARMGRAIGLIMQPAVVQADGTGLVQSLTQDGALPDAVYLPVVDPSLASFAEALRGSGVQLLGSTQWSALDLSGRPAFREAWFAAPDPIRFTAFDDAYREANGSAGGIISGLAFDGVELLRILGHAGELSARGLTREKGFTGVLGPYRFLRSGLCERGLGVLRVGAGEFSLIGSTSI